MNNQFEDFLKINFSWNMALTPKIYRTELWLKNLKKQKTLRAIFYTSARNTLHKLHLYFINNKNLNFFLFCLQDNKFIWLIKYTNDTHNFCNNNNNKNLWIFFFWKFPNTLKKINETFDLICFWITTFGAIIENNSKTEINKIYYQWNSSLY